MEHNSHLLASAPWRYKTIVLICVLFFSAGSHYTNSAVISLKSTLKTNLNVDNTQYAVMASSIFLINTILPFIGGIAIDSFGSSSIAIASTLFGLVGSGLAVVAAHFGKYWIMVVSRVVFGLGWGVVITCQQVILSQWFSNGSGLATAIGLQLSISKLFEYSATASVARIVHATAFYGNVFWVCTGVCAFSFTVALIYTVVLCRYRNHHRRNHCRVLAHEKQRFCRLRSSFTSLVHISTAYWVIPLNDFVASAVWFPFLAISVEFIQLGWHLNLTGAAWINSIALIVPVVASPLAGVFIDRFGRRGFVALLAAVLLVVSQVLLSYTHLYPVAGLVLFSLSKAIGPIAITSGIALIVPHNSLGVCTGLAKLGLNAGTVLSDVIAGLLQDHTSGGGYSRVCVLFLTLSCLSIGTVLLFWWADVKHFGGILSASHAKRTSLLMRPTEELYGLDDKVHLNQVPMKKKFVFATSFALFLSSWILYGVVLFGNKP
ncbi:MFS general substrate transporter [Ramicandelaber brevisporus]|nr:MFS general substrate transporter [Ramicandelaber brevisporus]